MDLADQITEELIKEVRRRLIEESAPRIEKCLNRLTDDQIWWRPNSESNSIGNLVLHLSGNVRQWIIAGVGGQPDTRTRNEEFKSGKLSTSFIADHIDDLIPDDLSTTNEALAHAAIAIVLDSEFKEDMSGYGEIQQMPWQIRDGWRLNSDGNCW